MNPVESGTICRECGATNDPGASECWLCHRRDWHRSPAVRPAPPAPAPTIQPTTIAVVLVLIAVVLIAWGAWQDAPGLSVLLLGSVLPALLVTELKARKRERRGEPMSAWDRVGSIIALTIVIPILVFGALFLALAVICLVTISRS